MRIETTLWFDKQLKSLAKKHKSIAMDYKNLLESLMENPTQGTLIRPNTYKIRMSITSKGKGKSGGSRVITYVHDEKDTVFLLDIYDKSERSNISDSDLTDFIDLITEG
jgi:mRNA-degrading endonuclease RelE of RelBE toxin-antitoxin system